MRLSRSRVTLSRHPCSISFINDQLNGSKSIMRRALGLILAASLATAAHADPLADLAAAQKATIDAWSKVPFSQQNVTFVSESSNAYGVYKARGSDVFKTGEPIITYVEPIGYGWKQLPGGLYEMHLMADLEIVDTSGEVLWSKQSYMDTRLVSHKQNMEFNFDMTLTLDGLSAGKYKLHYTLHDMTSGKTSSFDEDFELASGD